MNYFDKIKEIAKEDWKTFDFDGFLNLYTTHVWDEDNDQDEIDERYNEIMLERKLETSQRKIALGSANATELKLVADHDGFSVEAAGKYEIACKCCGWFYKKEDLNDKGLCSDQCPADCGEELESYA